MEKTLKTSKSSKTQIKSSEVSLYIVFWRETLPLAHYVDCLHDFCGILIGNEDENGTHCGTLYIMYHRFGKYSYREESMGTLVCLDEFLQFHESMQDFVKINASPLQIHQVSEICETCCDFNYRCNFSDKLLGVFDSFYPFMHTLEDHDIYTAKTLHTAQAVLLILQSGLYCSNYDEDDGDGKTSSGKTIYEKIKDLNGRTVYSTQLYRALTTDTSTTTVT